MAKKLNKIVDRKQIPFKYRARRPKIVQWAARLFLRSFRWKVEGIIPPVKGSENLIIIAGPHTSNWDGVFGFYGYFLAFAIGTVIGGYLFDKKYLSDGE
jgi:1-acyl-sn-glycerol-3-phosphate acyltransferase